MRDSSNSGTDAGLPFWRLAERTAWPVGLLLLGAGCTLTVAAALWSVGTLGFLALVTVFAGIFWIALGVMRRGYSRLQNRAGTRRP